VTLHAERPGAPAPPGPCPCRPSAGEARFATWARDPHAWRPATPGLRAWRTQMPAADSARPEAVAGDLLDELGYGRGAPPAGGDGRAAARLRARFQGRLLPARCGARSEAVDA
jgi:hypothetical protein